MPFSNSGFSSARGYTSTSGSTGSALSVGFVTSGSSSAAFHETREQGRLSANFRAKVAGLPSYDLAVRKPGDVWFHVDNDGMGAGHTNMTAIDLTHKVDSVSPAGVRKIPISKDRKAALVYRFQDQRVAQAAALLAEDWVGAVKYSDGAGATGLTFRTFSAAFGSSKFGVGAHARLLKYKTRMNESGTPSVGGPRNVICSEMCILAYQLVMHELMPGFIRLDAKHSIPSTLMAYFDGPGASRWTRVAYKG